MNRRMIYLDLFDFGVPLPHLLHVAHQLLVKVVGMLLHHHLQLEHLPDVWYFLTQDLVSVGLRMDLNTRRRFFF